MSLSRSQVENILTHVLKIDDWKILLQDDKFGFLKIFLRSYLNRFHFQNVTLVSVDSKGRRNPSESEVVERGLSGKGGVCIELNHFMKLIFDELGFDTFPVCCTWSAGLKAGTHIAIIVQFTIAESYYIDAGSAIPLWEPVPLHQLPYRNITGGHPFEIRRNSEGLIERFQLKSSYFTGKYGGGEKLQFWFFPTPCTFESFDTAMNFMFSSSSSVFLKQLFLFRHIIPNPREDTETCPKFIIVWGTKIVRGDADGIKLEEYSDYDQLKSVVMEDFPYLISSELEKSLDNFKKFPELIYRF